MCNWIPKCQFADCLPRERSMRWNIMQVYLSVWRYKSVNSFSIAHPVVLQMPLFMPHGMCQVHAAVLLCSHCTCLIVLSELWDVGAMKVLCRILHLSGASSSDVVENQERSSSVVQPFNFDPWGYQEYHWWLAILQSILDMKIMSHLQVTWDWSLCNSCGYDLGSGKNIQSSRRSC